jgi:hypothetical protein
VPDDDLGLALIAADDAIKLQRDTLDKGSQAVEWLVKTLTDLYAVNSVYRGDLGKLPVGRQMTIRLGNDVDDEATVSYAGWLKTFHRGDVHLPLTQQTWVAAAGNHTITLEVVNGGGFVWGATLQVDVEHVGRIVDANPNGNDLGFLGRRRMYIWTLTGV